MSSAADELAVEPIKLCLSGDSGTWKTSALTSLVLLGYKVRVINVDNGVKIVNHLLRAPSSPYANVISDLKIDISSGFRYETVNHSMIAMEVNKDRIRIQPKAAIVWPAIEKLATRWKESSGHDEGFISGWGTDYVLVLDSSTLAGIAALYYQRQLNNRLGAESQGREWQRDIGGAQDDLNTLLQLLYSSAVKCHVIVITHIDYMSRSEQRDKDSGNTTRIVSSNSSDIFGSERAYPSFIGRAMGPKVGRFFNDVYETRLEGVGRTTHGVIHTVPQGAGGVAVKCSAPFALQPKYDADTGLAEIFATLQGQPEPDFVRRLKRRTKQ